MKSSNVIKEPAVQDIYSAKNYMSESTQSLTIVSRKNKTQLKEVRSSADSRKEYMANGTSKKSLDSSAKAKQKISSRNQKLKAKHGLDVYLSSKR